MNGQQVRQTFRDPARSGATLLELLAVILIMLMITAMTIPVVAPAISGRRIREGARMVSTFINAARNRAIETGRPAGVWLERSRGLPEVCENLYMAEIPAPYGGDFLDSTVECVVVDKNGGQYFYDDVPGLQDYWNIVIPRTRTTFMTEAWSVPDSTFQQIVREGDEILIDGYDRRYRLRIVDDLPISTPVVSGTKWWYILRGRNCATNTGPLGPYTPAAIHYNGRYAIRWFDGTQYIPSWHLNATIRSTDTPGNFDRPGYRYKIYRQPMRLQAGSMRLPETVVIDLNFSSLAINKSDPGVPFHPRNGGGATPAAANLFGMYWGDALYPEDDTPVVVVFSPNGNVERIYCHVRDSQGYWSWESRDAAGPIYFLVGDRLHVTPGQFYTSQNQTENMAVQLTKNWLNLDALWVRITPNSGTISTSLVDDLSYQNKDTNAGVIAADPCNVHLTRASKAMNTRLVGGR